MARPCFISQIKDFPFSQDEIADVWRLAKGLYIDGGASFEDTIAGMARDLGMKREHIVQAFTMPKVARLVGNDVWSKMQRRRDAITQAKAVVEAINHPAWLQKIDTLYNVPRQGLTMGHGAVFPVTHMGQYMFIPSRWSTFFRTTGRAWSYMGKSGERRYEIALQRHLADPDYIMARRASRSVDPGQATVGILKNMKGWNARGFNSIKIARLELFKRRWSTLPPEERTLENAKSIMNVVDSATGEVHLGAAGKWMAKGLFAPKLLPARFKAALVDPYQALRTFANWKNASAGERAAAREVMSNTTQVIAFYAAAMALNQGLNMAFGSKEKVNFTDPSKSDWLSFKIHGLTIRPPNAIIEVARLAGGMASAFLTPQSQMRGKTSEQLAASHLSDYLRYKLHPTIRMALEGSSGVDLFGRPVPYPGLKQLATGEKPAETFTKRNIGWPEYLAGKGPIPIGGAAREFYAMLREEGMDHVDARAWIGAAVAGAIEGTGVSAHATVDIPPRFANNNERTKALAAMTPEERTAVIEQQRKYDLGQRAFKRAHHPSHP